MSTAWTTVELDWPRDPAGCADALADNNAELAWLDSADARPPHGQFTLLATRPLATLTQLAHGPATLATARGTLGVDWSSWNLWRATQDSLPRRPAAPFPLAPGWIGYVGFEAVRQLEHLPAGHAPDLGLPVVRLAFFDRALILDHAQHRAWACVASALADALPGAASDPPADWIDRCRAAVRQAASPRLSSTRATCDEIRGEDYERAVRRALEYIAAGDIYQVNLAHRVRIRGGGAPLALYARLRRVNPAPYAALLRWPDGAVASVSPELFLQTRGDAVLTRPIKGTRPRTHDAALDAAYRADLLGSAKEAAELAMIVDLHRNDLGRVCVPGSVEVPSARRLEAHPHVYHTVADVTGRMRPDRTPIDLLAAAFPAGSVTGVPKIRALQIINELEPHARGVYTGAIGALGLDGNLTVNVAIRTLQIAGETATLYVGGGIVADSDPAAEYAETLAKAAGILRGLGVGLDDHVSARAGDEPRA